MKNNYRFEELIETSLRLFPDKKLAEISPEKYSVVIERNLARNNRTKEEPKKTIRPGGKKWKLWRAGERRLTTLIRG